MPIGLETESKRGSDCTGSDGATNRVLTLANTLITDSDSFLVSVSGLVLIPDVDYTATHSSSASTITFLNPIFDEMYIVIQYGQGFVPTAGVYCTYSDIFLLTNLTASDVSASDVASIITEATKELNNLINVHVEREKIEQIDETRTNKIDSSNTTYYVKNWSGKFLADMDDDGNVDTSDITVYTVDTSTDPNTESTATVSSIDASLGKFVLSSAYSSSYELYVTYEWCYKNPYTPDPLIKLACTLLTAAYCYAKVNVGRAPQVAFGNTRIYRHIDSFDHYYSRFLKVVNDINSQQADYSEAETF